MAAVRLKRGDTAYPETTDMAGSIERLWKEELAEHFTEEEEHLFPLPDYPDAVRSMVERALDEHRRMRELVERSARGEDVEETARQLGLLLEAHIRFEERELFPAIQEVLSEEVIQRVGKGIKPRER
jgi:hemerythrin-like domain-containing protein